jgi:hypothetical protein
MRIPFQLFTVMQIRTYQASKNNADPRKSGSATLYTLHGLEQNGKQL